jgi:hypothetical protein
MLIGSSPLRDYKTEQAAKKVEIKLMPKFVQNLLFPNGFQDQVKEIPKAQINTVLIV